MSLGTTSVRSSVDAGSVDAGSVDAGAGDPVAGDAGAVGAGDAGADPAAWSSGCFTRAEVLRELELLIRDTVLRIVFGGHVRSPR
jgi:hypothetical protein